MEEQQAFPFVLYEGTSLRTVVTSLAKNTDLPGPLRLSSDFALARDAALAQAKDAVDRPVVLVVNPGYLDERITCQGQAYHVDRLNRDSFYPIHIRDASSGPPQYADEFRKVKTLPRVGLLAHVDDWVHNAAAELGIQVTEDEVKRIRSAQLDIGVSIDDPENMRRLESALASYFSCFGLEMIDETGKPIK